MGSEAAPRLRRRAPSSPPSIDKPTTANKVLSAFGGVLRERLRFYFVSADRYRGARDFTR